MSAKAVELFHDRSNTRARQITSLNVSSAGAGKSGEPSSLNWDPRSSCTTASEHSSIYTASIARSSVADENAVEKVLPDTDPTRTWFRSRKSSQPSIASPQGTGASPTKPNAKPPTAHSQPILEARFKNNPNGTALTTIIERRSSASLRKTIREITKRRSFTPVHSTAVLATGPVHDTASRLSLDDAAIHELHKITRNQDRAGGIQRSSSTTANEEQTQRPHTPVSPPFKRTTTPPGVPRWPGDLKPGDASPRRSSLGFSHSLRDRFLPPGNVRTRQSMLGIQRRRTSRLPRRVGQAYWRPPRSAHISTSHTGLRHPFYHVPLASRVNPVQITARARTGQVLQGTSGVGQVDPPQASSVRPISPLGIEDGQDVTIESSLFVSGHCSQSLTSVSNGVSREERTDTAFIDSRVAVSAEGHDQTSTAAMVSSPDGRRDSAQDGYESSRSPTTEVLTACMAHSDSHRWRADTVEIIQSSHPPPIASSETPANGGNEATCLQPHHQPEAPLAATQQKRIISAAIPILPIAEREGIVRSIRLVPVSASEPNAVQDGARSDPNADIQYDERVPRTLQGQELEDTNNARTRQASKVHFCARCFAASGAKRHCWRCRAEKGVLWVLEECFCQAGDAGEGTEAERIRVVFPPPE